jgi:hypothetical protein
MVVIQEHKTYFMTSAEVNISHENTTMVVCIYDVI